MISMGKRDFWMRPSDLYVLKLLGDIWEKWGNNCPDSGPFALKSIARMKRWD